jgi:hypothetical protein
MKIPEEKKKKSDMKEGKVSKENNPLWVKPTWSHVCGASLFPQRKMFFFR